MRDTVPLTLDFTPEVAVALGPASGDRDAPFRRVPDDPAAGGGTGGRHEDRLPLVARAGHHVLRGERRAAGARAGDGRARERASNPALRPRGEAVSLDEVEKITL